MIQDVKCYFHALGLAFLLKEYWKRELFLLSNTDFKT